MNENVINMSLVEAVSALMEVLDKVPLDDLPENWENLISDKLKEELMKDNLPEKIINELRDQYDDIEEVKKARDEISTYFAALGINYGLEEKSETKVKLFRMILSMTLEIVDKYIDSCKDITLTIALEPSAKVPTYAHPTDAAADIYALEDTLIPGNSLGNKIRTGIKIALPEKWVAYIVPRSSIGTKTPLRQSNSIGVIDSGYRGEIGVLYDNISDSDYTIKAGDRIAQMIIMPCYQFKAVVVDELDETDRGESGFGSTGK